MLSVNPALIAVIDPVEPDLFRAWVAHYRALGIDRFLLGFRFPSGTPADRRSQLEQACRDVAVSPSAICTGYWPNDVEGELREALRVKAGGRWHLLAGGTEFQTYPASLPEVIRSAERNGHRIVEGVLLDRVSADGHLVPLDWQRGLDRVFPLGGHLTSRLLEADPRRIALASADATLSSGNHDALDTDTDTVVAVHNFAWTADALSRLVQSAECTRTARGESEHDLAVRERARRLMTHIEKFGGRIDVADPRLRCRYVSLARMPSGWGEEARGAAAVWGGSAREAR